MFKLDTSPGWARTLEEHRMIAEQPAPFRLSTPKPNSPLSGFENSFPVWAQCWKDESKACSWFHCGFSVKLLLLLLRHIVFPNDITALSRACALADGILNDCLLLGKESPPLNPKVQVYQTLFVYPNKTKCNCFWRSQKRRTIKHIWYKLSHWNYFYAKQNWKLQRRFGYVSFMAAFCQRSCWQSTVLFVFYFWIVVCFISQSCVFFCSRSLRQKECLGESLMFNLKRSSWRWTAELRPQL